MIALRIYMLAAALVVNIMQLIYLCNLASCCCQNFIPGSVVI